MILRIVAVGAFVCHCMGSLTETVPDTFQLPTVVFHMTLRNCAHNLPFFLGGIELLDYPKDRIRLFVHVAQDSSDDTAAVFDAWRVAIEQLYAEVDVEYDKASTADEDPPYLWTIQRMQHMTLLREQALNYARSTWSDFLFSIDCDQFLTNPSTLRQLVYADRPVVAPMLTTVDQRRSVYSNFWGDMTEDYFYKRSRNYLQVLAGNITGLMPVANVHSCYLIDLRRTGSRYLTYDRSHLQGEGPEDDVVTFGRVLAFARLKPYLLNSDHYGYLLEPLGEDSSIDDAREHMSFLLTELLYDGPPGLLRSVHLKPRYPKTTFDGLDRIYLINLDRRPDRWDRMKQCLDILGMTVSRSPAVDGVSLTDSRLAELGVTVLNEFRDPHHDRPVTRGEIGCFLSHYNIWRDVLSSQLDLPVLVLEDDVRFEPVFVSQLKAVIREASNGLQGAWDLIYIGRKRLNREDVQPACATCDLIYTVGYTYWTLGYLLSPAGARKLLDAKPLDKLVPVDEYLPIMYDVHPNKDYSAAFQSRNLRAFTAEPLLLHPVRYTGQDGYVSDTEWSETINYDQDSDSDDFRYSSTSEASESRSKEEL